MILQLQVFNVILFKVIDLRLPIPLKQYPNKKKMKSKSKIIISLMDLKESRIFLKSYLKMNSAKENL
jgi:hypothetical protein